MLYIPIFEHQSKVYIDGLSKADLINYQFVIFITHENLLQIPKMKGSQVPEVLDVDIEIEYVTKLLKELD